MPGRAGDDSQAASRPMKPASQGWATIKQVLSGDTVVIMGQAKEYAVAPTKRVQLQYIMCPRAMRSRNTDDEAFGWDALEFSRNLLIGQAVQFIIPSQEKLENQNIPDYGNIFVKGRSVAEVLLENGWAKCKQGRDIEVPEKYLQLEQAAKDAKIGRWQDVKGDNFMQHIRQCNYDVDSDDIRQIWLEYYGKSNLTVNVNKVLTGSTLLCELTRQKDATCHKSLMIRCHLAGVRCPETLLPFNLREKRWKEQGERRGEPKPKMDDSVPWAEEARNYSEIRLLNRDIELELITKDTNSRNVYVNVVIPAYPDRNISLSLLSTGLAKIQKWSKNALPTASQQRFEMAQNHAKQQRLSQWRDFKPAAAATPSASTDFQARVVQIVSGDCIIVQKEGSTTEERMTLASLRTPRMRRGGQYGQPGEDWSREAHEYLRSKLIGRKVRVVKEYSRKPGANSFYKDDQQFVSIYRNGECLNVSMVKEGFADVIPHRQDDERATEYSNMSLELERAKTAGKRRWGPTPPKTAEIEDLAVRFGPPPKGKDPNEVERTRIVAMNQAFQKKWAGTKIDAVVEHVFSGGRFKVFVPKTNQMLIYLAGGLRTPRYSQREPERCEPWGKESYQLARDKVLQRSITLIPEACDRGGNVIGQILYNNKSENLGESLLRKGLAKINFYSARESKDWGERLIAADQKAKDEQLRIYTGYDPEVERAEREARWRERNPEEARRRDDAAAAGPQDAQQRRGGNPRPESLQGKTKQVYVTHVVDATTFYVNFMDSMHGEKMTIAMSELQGTDENVVSEEETLDKWKIYGGLFDGGYYRVQRVKGGKPNADGTYTFKFIDFGNEDDLLVSDLISLPDELTRVEPLAKECQFAGLRAPDATSEWFQACGEAAAEMILNKNLDCKVLVQMRDILEVELLTESGQSIGLELCKQGNMTKPARVGSALQRNNQKYLKQVDEAVDVAKSRRLKLWRYGDPGDGSEDDKKQRERDMKGVDVSKIVRTRDGRLKQAL